MEALMDKQLQSYLRLHRCQQRKFFNKYSSTEQWINLPREDLYLLKQWSGPHIQLPILHFITNIKYHFWIIARQLARGEPIDITFTD